MFRGIPAIGWSRSPRTVSSRGTLSSRPSVYGCRGRLKRSSTGPVSTNVPAYMTFTRSHIPATTPRSCVIRTSAAFCSPYELPQEIEDLRLDRHVERCRRLVGDEELRLPRERHRDHRPLAHPARELVRIVLEPLLGARDTDAVEQHRGARVGVLLRHPEMRLQCFADLLPDRQHRVQARHGVLEDHRDVLAPNAAKLAIVQLVRSCPRTAPASRSASRGSQGRPAPGCPRSARLADTERLAWSDLEGDPVHR